MRFLITFKALPERIEKRLREERNMYLNEEVENMHIYSNKPLKKIDGGLLLGFKIYSGDILQFKEFSTNNIMEIDKAFDGKYLYIDLGKNILFSDPLGLQPVFIGENAISSEKKSLWMIDEKNISFLPPNKFWKFEERNIFSNIGNMIKYNHGEKMHIDLEDASQFLCEYLTMRMKIISSIVKKYANEVYIAFSGGVDSSLTYILAEKAGLKPWLITVAKKDSHDLEASISSAKLLDAENRHVIIPLDEKHIDIRDIRKIIEAIENSSLMQLSLAIPLYLITNYYAKMKVIFMGQGSDELYAGYTKYMLLYKEGEEAVEGEILKDIIFSYRFNFNREMKIADLEDTLLIYPLISPGIVKFVIQLPIQYKIIDENDEMRKWLIRRVAEKCMVPRKIVMRKKKSMQYSSGSQNLLIKLLGKRKVQEKIYGYYLELMKKYN